MVMVYSLVWMTWGSMVATDGCGDWFARKLQDLCQVMGNETHITPTVIENGCLGLALDDKLLHGKHDGDGFTVVTSGDL